MACSGKIDQLQTSFAATEKLRSFIKQRKDLLKKQLQNTGLLKEIKSLQKKAYYYNAQLAEYREILQDRSRAEKKAIAILAKSKPWKDFIRRNSQLASMFRMPGGADGPDDISASLQGLQTRSQVNALIMQRLGTNADAIAQMRQNVQGAQSQLSQLQQKAASLGTGSFGSSGNLDLPENFKPNSQKTKSFWKRLELGTNIQTQKARYFFPVTTDVALSVGYKLNDKSLIGIGTSYKLGLGTGWRNIEVSHQGISLRAFIDYKIQGGIYISGGYEQNFRTEINSVDQLKDYSNWQSSGLIGISKKYKINKKFNGDVKLLWDFLSYGHVPKSQPIIFQLGYSFSKK